jgi:hypothetical protein
MSLYCPRTPEAVSTLQAGTDGDGQQVHQATSTVVEGIVCCIFDHGPFEMEYKYGDDEQDMETGPFFAQHQIL